MVDRKSLVNLSDTFVHTIYKWIIHSERNKYEIDTANGVFPKCKWAFIDYHLILRVPETWITVNLNTLLVTGNMVVEW